MLKMSFALLFLFKVIYWSVCLSENDKQYNMRNVIYGTQLSLMLVVQAPIKTLL